MPIIFHGTDNIAYRDPACVFTDGKYHLFFTVSKKEDGYMYNFVAHSESEDLKSFSEPVIITEKDRSKNFCSPGNIIKVNDKYLICVTSYPMPVPFEVVDHADDSARLFFIETEDFKTYSSPKRIYPKGKACADEGRMIDPFVAKDKDHDGRYLVFFKQNGVSMSESYDLENWNYLGRIDGGENACIIVKDDLYYLIHSPRNGIGVKVSNDLKEWSDRGVIIPKETEEEWANGRLTAAFAMENLNSDIPFDYIVFFHGSRKEATPETHGAASLAMYYTNDFKTYVF